jgi:hypothetical protein
MHGALPYRSHAKAWHSETARVKRKLVTRVGRIAAPAAVQAAAFSAERIQQVAHFSQIPRRQLMAKRKLCAGEAEPS